MSSRISGRIYQKIKSICPALHFLLTFLFERRVFYFDHNFDFLDTMALSSLFSDKFELIMAYIITKLISLILIILLWKLFFAIIDRTVPLKTTIIFSSVFIVGLVIILILWPNFTLYNIDNYMLYAYAVRFVPEYWHSIYSGCFMGACLMVFPHPFTINVIEWLWFVSIMGYIYHRIGGSSVLPHKLKHIVIVFFILPFIHIAVTDPYRSELYAMFSFFFFALIIFDAIEGIKRTGFQLFVIIVGLAMIAVWRSEGIILGVGLFLCMYLTIYKTSFIKTIIPASGMVLAILLLSFPSFVGTQKYYGDDYSFINYMDVLQTILNSKEANLQYDGADDDLDAINAIVDLEVLKEHGVDGYRRFNSANGRLDINQSLATKDVREAANKAYKNIVIHNAKLYYKHHVNYFCKALSFEPPYSLDEYSGAGSGYAYWSFNLWNVGLSDYYSFKTVYDWEENLSRYDKACKINEWFEYYSDWWEKNGIIQTFNVLIIAINIVIALYEFIKCILRKRISAFFILSVTLFAQIAAIAAVMPAASYFYLRTYYYCALLMAMVYIPASKAIKRSEQERSTT